MSKKRRKARKRRKQAREAAKKVLYTLITIVILLAALIVVNEKWLHCKYIPSTEKIIDFLGIERHPEVIVEQDEISVHFIDVGQGDCIFIDTPDKDMLIDCGEVEYASRVIRYLHRYDVRKLDYIIASHPHSDHMGGMSRIMTAFHVGEFIMPDVPSDMIPTLDFYTDAMNVVSAKGIALNYSQIGRSIELCEGTRLDIIGPIGTGYSDLNSYSVIAKLVSGNRSFLFTGDTEKDAEYVLTDSWLIDISADVIKVPHHGSSSSSSVGFVKRVDPEYAVISVGADNTYGHPSTDVVAFYRAMDCEVLMTMHSGDIVFITDGNDIRYVEANSRDNAA